MKPRIVVVVVLMLLLAGGLVWKLGGRSDEDAPPPMAAERTGASLPHLAPKPRVDAEPPLVREPLPGQGKAIVEGTALAGGAASGRVINWSTGAGVANAELTFTSDGGATTVRTNRDGGFELAPPAPGVFRLAAIAAQGFLPYAPELQHSPVQLALAKDRAVRGITVFLFPAVPYRGRVVDKTGAAVAGARVRLLGTPAGEQVIDKLETEWTTDKQGEFAFHAADDAVFEAVHGKERGWARLDGRVALTRKLLITIADAPARDATITGRVVDGSGKPVADALVRADPAGEDKPVAPRATAFATTGDDGAFVLEHLDRELYTLTAEAEDHAPISRDEVRGGARGIMLALDAGARLAGRVRTRSGDPVPAFTLLVSRRLGTARELVLARSIVDPNGAFAVRIAPGDYELEAAAPGWAPSERVDGTAGGASIELVVTAGATLRGTVVSAADQTPISYARIMREAHGGGASAQPSNAGTVTRDDGTFELTGIRPGPVSITIGAGGFHPRIEGGMTATDDAQLGPIVIALAPLKDGEQPTLELVGIGVALAAEGDALRVNMVMENSGAALAGIVVGDRIVAIDGIPAVELGIDGAVSKIRGVEGTTVSLTLRREDTLLPLVVQRRKLRA